MHPIVLCECDHESDQHDHGTGRCRGTDSYGLPCECPALAAIPDDDEDGDVGAELERLEAEVRADVPWRARCGAPNLARCPVRCRRGLGHADDLGHAGLLNDDVLRWPGDGNARSGHTGPDRQCWCAGRSGS